MANTVYMSKAPVNAQNKARAYEALCVLIAHLQAFGVDLVSLSRDVNGYVIVTLSGPVPSNQLDHVGLQE